MKTHFVALLVGVALQIGCSSNRAASCASTSDASASGGCDEVMCTSSSVRFPTFDKACASATDCAIGLHQTDCCGATLAIGMTKAEQARFAADEKICVDQYPLCGCPASPTMTEDGQSAAPGTAIVVKCQSGQCMTTVQ